MVCFSCCFRIRDDNDNHTHINRFYQPITAIDKEPIDPLASNCVWSPLAQEDEDGDLSRCEDGRYGITGSPILDEELRAEAKFLKACGTLPETPVEIRRTEISKDLPPHKGETESTFNSVLPNTAIEEALQKQPDQLQSPISLLQKWDNGSDSSPHSSDSFKNTDSISSNSFDGCEIGPAASTQCKVKSVHFASQSDSCSSSSKSSSPKITKAPLKINESPFDHSISKPSPYPTPLKLTDDMQTPGTVFPSKIRVQYAHSGINPRNFSQLDTPIEEECIDKESPQSQVKLQESSTRKELNMCPTLSSWLAPKSNNEGDIDQSLTRQTPGDRRILGVIKSDLNADETSFTPKWGDCNGIPNTTNKYSEDQKVSWHATPFEERLEKVLSEDKSIPKMKQLGGTRMSNYDDEEEHENAGC
ncbi:hypothetical protein QVD17_32156 [Tagetes erecta]|uniref:Uncharacterized protein n=1 Tax=Tagetes erecta TaxID=13708 RepID=A0AAD8KBA1_TARER|nr:hypothetical protein QVD17_32156 [Tagetes erecta]